MNKYLVPKITAEELWSMNDKEFNAWRQTYDFPRIIKFFHDKLPLFSEWMKKQKISDTHLIKHGPARFIRPFEVIFLYELEEKDNENNKIEFLDIKHYDIGNTRSIDNKLYKFTSVKQEIIPYFKWGRGQRECVDSRIETDFFINTSSGRKNFIYSELELLDAGNVTLFNNYLFGERNLEFINLDNLKINHAFSSAQQRLWYSTAKNLSIEGSFTFIDAYKTIFYDSYIDRKKALILSNGNYQRWSFTDCAVNIRMSNSEILYWKVFGYDFDISLDKSNIVECYFSEGTLKHHWQYENAFKFHKKIKNLYSQIGKQADAGHHFYLEKEFERKSLFYPHSHYSHYHLKYGKSLTVSDKLLLYPKAFLKSISLLFQKFLWGYGEKPIRIILVSGTIILVSSCVYYTNLASQTHDELFNSFYSSIVTFTTLGTGDINPSTNFWLKICVALEAFSGFALMGLFIAGFASKSKDY